MNISKQIQNCRKTNNFELGLELLNKNLSINNIKSIISIYIDNIEQVYTYNVQDIVKLIDKYDYTLYCQLINIYCLTNDINMAYQTLLKTKDQYRIYKRKLYLPFINYYNINKCRKYIEYIVNDIISNRIKLESSDYMIFIDILNNEVYYDTFIRLIKYAISTRIIVNTLENTKTITKNCCESCQKQLKMIETPNKIYIDILDKIEQEITNIDKHFDKFKRWCNKNAHIDTIIDGGNVGYFNNRTSKNISIIQINSLMSQLNDKNIKLFLHNRHVRYLNGREQVIVDNWKKNDILYLTKSKINDDYYWLYFSIFLKLNKRIINVISNDNMMDHIFYISENLKYIRNEIQVKYQLDDYNFLLIYPPNYSIITQISDNYIHIPTESGKWLCMPLLNI